MNTLIRRKNFIYLHKTLNKGHSRSHKMTFLSKSKYLLFKILLYQNLRWMLTLKQFKDAILFSLIMVFNFLKMKYDLKSHSTTFMLRRCYVAFLLSELLILWHLDLRSYGQFFFLVFTEFSVRREMSVIPSYVY